MNEQQWLASDDPSQMLGLLRDASLDGWGRPSFPVVSDRKLRLFASAAGCPECDRVASGFGALLYAEYVARGCCRSRAEKADLLREVGGNPFRPVTLPLDQVVRRVARVRAAGSVGPGVVMGCSWLTTTVLSLAQAAYEERPRRECGNCGGDGFIHDDAPPCSACDGTGRIDDGALDPFRLAVLSDALEEAGCADEQILAHLRSPGPHVRGCWALDVILGKE